MKIFIGLILLYALASAVVVEKWQKTADGSAYYLHNECKFNWFQAWNECASRNMSLLVIDSLYKHQQIDQMLKKLYTISPAIWLAAHDNAVDRRYEWATTGVGLSFTNWAAGEPNHAQNREHCLAIWQKKFEWYDFPCGSKHCYICEENPQLKAMDKELQDQRKNCNIMNLYKTVVLNVHSNQN